MGLNYRNLDTRTRALMAKEIEGDLAQGKLYLSDNLNEQGRRDYPDLIKAAVAAGSDDSLAADIRPRLNTHEKPHVLRSGKLSKPPVMRSNAHEMLAEGEFNRFYIRALCLRAIEDGVPEVVVYRAKWVERPRPESEPKIGQRIRAVALLEDLRQHVGIDTALGLPPGPNSGLSVELP